MYVVVDTRPLYAVPTVPLPTNASHPTDANKHRAPLLTFFLCGRCRLRSGRRRWLGPCRDLARVVDVVHVSRFRLFGGPPCASSNWRRTYSRGAVHYEFTPLELSRNAFIECCLHREIWSARSFVTIFLSKQAPCTPVSLTSVHTIILAPHRMMATTHKPPATIKRIKEKLSSTTLL